jgi:exodeoxyribonuclease-3
VKLATWNVNSLRVRLPQVLDWIAVHKPDLLALQETKVADDEFPRAEIEASGYHVLYSGQRGYNGVAILSKQPPDGEAVIHLPGVENSDRRLLCADYGDLRLLNLYVPNGKQVGSDQYDYKLAWLQQLTQYLRKELKRRSRLVLVGDLNIAADERDVYKPILWENQIMFSGPERAAFQELLKQGLVDVLREKQGDLRLFTWWDYRFGAFRRDYGLRIDYILASPHMARHCIRAEVDRIPRGWPRPSDHAPVVAEFA